MSTFNKCGKKIWILAFLLATMLISATVHAGYDPADVQTTTRFQPPFTIGVAVDGMIFPGDPFIGCEVVQMRITWDIVVAGGHDAADIFADVYLPIQTHSGIPASIILDGTALRWSGSGTFNHYEETDRFNGFFGQVGTGFGSQSWGLPPDAVDVLPTSRIEIDYLVPEPATISLLALGGMGLLGKYKNRWQ